ncbi:hypothetical protein BJ875DRAFT_137795 [Amylocarpus encephaloides]|uniref:Rhodopsin domain-containing protein n=1 Tax=Amylocarpus encephaloides TaxID=45428 RepID=A0A9P7YCH6_9HELO|nr:hypothetical protein BJ875DRAFT_137795 [Amylocarpus encephaloides]
MDVSQIPPEQLAQMPAGPSPNGEPPNFINPESRSPGATASIVVILSIAMIVLWMRIYSRARISKQLGVDDLFAMIAGAVSAAMSGVAIALLNQGGFGPHTWNVRLTDLLKPHYNYMTFTLNITNFWSSAFAKLSILFFLLRVFPRKVRPTIAYLIYIGAAINGLFYCILTIYTGVVCAPRQSTGGFYPAKCTPAVRLQTGQASAAVNAFLDLYILAISLPTLWALQLPKGKKLGVIAVLCTGILACICSLIVLYYRVHFISLLDFSWDQVLPITVGIWEPLVALITACLPALPALWVAVSRTGFSSIRNMLSFSRRSGTQRSNDSYRLEDHEPSEHSSNKSLNGKENGIRVQSSFQTQYEVVEDQVANPKARPFGSV